ncbi:MAG: hypothetical protein WBC80_24820, partial [Isosphaeraceae bacterium]
LGRRRAQERAAAAASSAHSLRHIGNRWRGRPAGRAIAIAIGVRGHGRRARGVSAHGGLAT